MNINELQTPAILLNLDVMEHNLKKYSNAASDHNKQLWPMIKTHKSITLAKLQVKYGCTGFLCGTLDEAEMLADAGFNNIMYAYPVATDVSIDRVIRLSKRCNFILRIDSHEAAALIHQRAKANNVKINYTLIIDSGLHRFGIPADKAVSFVENMQVFDSLVFEGISTHTGQVYGGSDKEDVIACAAEERNAICEAARALKNAGYQLEIISSGTTPTFFEVLEDENINILHPGNYIFNDYIQQSLGIANESECALYVLASVIAHPSDDLYICDAGAKCLGLDKGAHGNESIKGYGYIKGHPELTIYSLSEEVGKLHVNGSTDIKIGDKLMIIPNHSCSTANLTDYFIGIREEQVEMAIKVDARSNHTAKNYNIL